MRKKSTWEKGNSVYLIFEDTIINTSAFCNVCKKKFPKSKIRVFHDVVIHDHIAVCYKCFKKLPTEWKPCSCRSIGRAFAKLQKSIMNGSGNARLKTKKGNAFFIPYE